MLGLVFQIVEARGRRVKGLQLRVAIRVLLILNEEAGLVQKLGVVLIYSG